MIWVKLTLRLIKLTEDFIMDNSLSTARAAFRNPSNI